MRWMGILAMSSLLSACTALLTFPKELSLTERQAAFPNQVAPVKAPVNIYWDQHSIPFIEAKNSLDAAFGIGMVHAHLRIGQMEFMRVLSQGRFSEVAGPISIVTDIDHGLRILNFKGAARAAIAGLDAETKAWMEAYVAGLNWYIASMPEPPLENRIMNVDLEPYTMLDVMTIGRLAGADLSWGVYLRFLKLLEEEGGEEAFQAMVDQAADAHATAVASHPLGLEQIINQFSKSGSNSLAVAGSRTASGSAMIANDPHVGLLLPNFWLLAGVSAPDFEVVGLMIPGLPFFGVGRNRDIAWGGTNMRGISSHLFDVRDLPADQFTERKELIKRRWWFDTTRTIRETPFGPVLTDLGYFDQEQQPMVAALQWQGQQASNEIGAFLKANRAKNFADFKQAFADYRVSAQNMLYADVHGHVGMVAAYGQPVLSDPSKTLDLVKQRDNPVIGTLPPPDMPSVFDPEEGFVASANNKPFSNPEIPIAFSYAVNNRFDRLREMMAARPRVTLDDLKQVQLDVFSREAVELRDLLVAKIGERELPDAVSKYLVQLRQWDGNYAVQSRGAVVFEVIFYHAWQDYLDQLQLKPAVRSFYAGRDDWKRVLKPWLGQREATALAIAFEQWVASGRGALEDFQSWGDFHVQQMQHPFGRVPLIGSRFKRQRYGELGGNDTLNKNGRPFRPEAADVTYGAAARHISDMADANANYFVLKGGQDGWLMNPQISDQLSLWRAGSYVRVPLDLDEVKRRFAKSTVTLSPQG